MKKKTKRKSSKKKKKIAIFVDGNNFRHGLKALLSDDNIDWKLFLKEVTRDHELSYANYYIGKITSPLFDEKKVKKQAKLFKQLKKANINLWEGYFNDDKHEKGVDVQIALDLVIGSIEKHFDLAVLISGDGDLSNAVRIAQHYGTRVILGYVAGTKSGNYRISWRLKSVSSSAAALNTQIEKAAESWNKKHPNKKKSDKKTSKKKASKPKKKPKKEQKRGKKLLLFADGGSRGNPGKAGCGAVICDESGNVLKKISEFIGTATNNTAEYKALLLGLKAAQKMKPEQLTCYLDSKLVVEQAKGKWKVKKDTLKPLHAEVVKYLLKHPNTSFHHIPREKNTEADKLANLAMDRGK